MLVVWLFGIAAGWANACLLQAGLGSHGHAPAHESPGGLHERGAVQPAAAPHDDTDAGLEACLSFCDNEQGTIPKPKLPMLADLGTTLPTPARAWVPGAVDRAPGRGRPRATAPPPGPPVAIRFLRLTI